MHSRVRLVSSLLLATAFALLAGRAPAAPVLRHQADIRGDVAVIGSTLAFDCGSGVSAPAGATASCGGQTNLTDTAPDLYWRDAVADASITPTQARTAATLVLPAGAVIQYARLYWAALRVGGDPDTSVVLDRLYGPQVTVTADHTTVIPYGMPAHPDWSYYQATADVTAFVVAQGPGDFRVTGVEAVPLAGLTYDIDRSFSAWTLVVFYGHPSDDLRNVALFDAFEWVDPGLGQPSVAVTLAGFLVPDGFNARMTAFAYEGDKYYTGDRFLVNNQVVSNALNPADDFFNGTRTYLGQPVSGAKDVPKLSGQPGSMAGYDLDTVDVTALLKVGDTSATVAAESSADIFMLGGFVTSVTSLSPDFAGSTKTAKDLNGGAILSGDVIEYTITLKNGGNDPSVKTALTDTLDAGLEYVPSSITVGGAAKTDGVGDDTAEYTASTRTITVRLGTGANATTGGGIAAGESVEVRFRAKIVPESGSIPNQGTIKASGQSGCHEKTWLTDGDPATPGAQPTVVIIDQCVSDEQCQGRTPRCDPTTHSCHPCAADADCSVPGLPACQPDGSCGECSATNHGQCVDPNSVCNVQTGTCVPCTTGPQGNNDVCADDPNGTACVPQGSDTHCGCFVDSDCGSDTSGRVCDAETQTCFNGCRGMYGNGCPAGYECTSTDTTMGACRPVSTTPAVGEVGAGCGCRAPVQASSGLGFLALAALAALMVRRRSS